MYVLGVILKLCSIFLAQISNYIDKVTDIIQAKLLGDFHMVISMGGESLQTGGRVQQRGEI